MSGIFNKLDWAPGYCPHCATNNRLFWIPKSRNGNRGRICKVCEQVTFKPVTGETLPPRYNMDDEDFEGISN